MDHDIHSGHESHHGVHLCHRCGWPFPNPQPSAKHRRAHKKHCGTIEGYTNLTQVVSDDEEKTPSPKIAKTGISGDGGGTRGSFSRSEEDFFSDAVTEFSDSGTSAGSANKTLDRDLFLSFNDAENGGTNDVVNAPMEINKVDASLEVSKKQDAHVEKSGETETTVCDLSESKLELTDKDAQCSDGLVKGRVVEPTPDPSYVSQSQEAKSIEVVEAGEEKSQESQTFETITEEAKDSEIRKTTPEVSETVGGCDDIIKQENFEKLESLTADGTSEEIRQEIESDSEHVSEVVKVSEAVETVDRISEEIKHEKIELDHVVTPEAVKEPETIEGAEEVSDEIKLEKSEPDREHAPEVAKDSEIDQTVPVMTEKDDLGAPKEQTQEVVEEPDLGLTENCLKEGIQVVKERDTVITAKEDLGEPILEEGSNEHTHKVVEIPGSVLTEKENLGEPELEKCSKEEIQVVKESDTVFTAKEDLGEPILEEGSNEHAHKVVELPGSVLTEKENLGEPELEKCSKEHIQEVLKEQETVLTEKENLGEPELEKCLKEQIQEVLKEQDTVLTEKEDLGEPQLEKHSNEPTQEVVEKPESNLTQKQDLGATILEKSSKESQPDSVLTEKEDLGASESEKCLKENAQEVIERKGDQVSNDVADVSVETVRLKDSSDNSIDDGKNASGVVPEPIVEGNGKLMNNQESGPAFSVDSNSRNSLEGNWGSVSVLSTASIDAETLHGGDKSKVNPEKSTAATSDVYEPPSFMTLVEPEGKDQKSGSSDVQDLKHQPNFEVTKAGWFPTLTKVNESEGRKRNEEGIAKVTNWSSGKQSTPLKNLLGEAKSPSAKQPESVVQKDKAANEKAGETPLVNQDVSSPPKLIEDGKKGRKKVKGRSLWVPFVCCSSVNVN